MGLDQRATETGTAGASAGLQRVEGAWFVYVCSEQAHVCPTQAAT